MKKILLALALLTPAAALALDAASIPPKFPIPWGNSAGSPTYIRSIPTNSQIGTQNCAASLTDGFPPLTFTPSIAGGCPPFGQDFNGILKQITQWSRWQAAGGPVFYDSGFAASIGGYPAGTRLSSAVVPGHLWLSTTDNNSSDPDNAGGGWVQDPGQVPTGTPMQSLSNAVPYGYVSANGTTIGNASSNATGRANADTQFLFANVWTTCAAAACPIFTSTGSPTTRGATPAADFAANKALSTPNMNGSGMVGADQNGSSFLSGAPVVSGNGTTAGSILGSNLQSLTIANLPVVTPAGSVASTTNSFVLSGVAGNYLQNVTLVVSGGPIQNFGVMNGGTGTFSPVNSSGTLTGTPFGSNVAHNILSRSLVVLWNLRL